jgi:T5SS/PEP-CTERM-associated repeat protein
MSLRTSPTCKRLLGHTIVAAAIAIGVATTFAGIEEGRNLADLAGAYIGDTAGVVSGTIQNSANNQRVVSIRFENILGDGSLPGFSFTITEDGQPIGNRQISLDNGRTLFYVFGDEFSPFPDCSGNGEWLLELYDIAPAGGGTLQEAREGTWVVNAVEPTPTPTPAPTDPPDPCEDPPISWLDPASGEFDDDENWLGDASPAGDDNATAAFDSAGEYTVSFGLSTSTDALVVSQGNVGFDLNGATYGVTGSALCRDSIVIGGEDPIQSVSLTISNGTLDGHSTILAPDDGSAEINIESQGELRTRFLCDIGLNAQGSVFIKSGGVLTSEGDTVLSGESNSRGLVVVQGVWNVLEDAKLTIGENAAADVTVGSGGVMTILPGESAEISSKEGAVGSILLIQGDGATFQSFRSLFVGVEGGGDGPASTLSIRDGGRASFTGSDAGVSVAFLVQSRGEIRVDGAGSELTSEGLITFGDFGDGKLFITTGGKVTSDSLRVGFGDESEGSASISGSGTSLTVASDMTIGDSGNGVLTVSNGANVTSTNAELGAEASGVGLVEIKEQGAMTVSDTLRIGETGQGTVIVETTTSGLLTATNIECDMNQVIDSQLVFIGVGDNAGQKASESL